MESKPDEPHLIIEDHESPFRRIIHHAEDLPYNALRSLEEAKSFSDAFVIIESEWGGHIHMTCPASLVRCSPEALNRLLHDLDSILWPENEGAGAGVYYERDDVGSELFTGMGGGWVTEDIWIHAEVAECSLEEAIREVLDGRRDVIPSPPK